MSNSHHRPAEELTLFHDVHRAHKNAIAAALAAKGLQDIGQPKILLLLSSLPESGATQTELAEAVHVSPSTMTASLKSLEANGYVTRRPDSHDARVKRIAITEKGMGAVKCCEEAFRFVDTQIYAGFTSEEVERLKSDYHRMLDNLFAIGGNFWPDQSPTEKT